MISPQGKKSSVSKTNPLTSQQTQDRPSNFNKEDKQERIKAIIGIEEILLAKREQQDDFYALKNLASTTIIEAQNLLIYGVEAQVYNEEQAEPIQATLFLNSSKQNAIQVLLVNGQTQSVLVQIYDIDKFSTGIKYEFKHLNSNSEQLFISAQIKMKKFILKFQIVNDRNLFYYSILWVQDQFFQKRIFLVNSQSWNKIQQYYRQYEDKNVQQQDLYNLLQRINVKVSNKTLGENLKNYQSHQQSTEELQYYSLKIIFLVLRDILEKPELRLLFNQLQSERKQSLEDDGAACLSIQTLKQFLQDKQQQEITNTDLRYHFPSLKPLDMKSFHATNEFKDVKLGANVTLYNRFDSDIQDELNTSVLQQISFAEFKAFIFSKKNSLFNPKFGDFYQNMNLPLSDYYVKSGRNVFLSNFNFAKLQQNKKYSNIVPEHLPLIYALQNGYRFLEFEVWDGEHNQPILIYGHTQTSRLSAQIFLATLLNYAFVQSSFPLFIQFEVHCSISQKFILKQMIELILRDYIFKIPYNYKEIYQYPSPLELKNKIILVGKSNFNDPLCQENSSFLQINQISDIEEQWLNKFNEEEELSQRNKDKQFDLFVSNLKKSGSEQPKLKTFLDKKFEPTNPQTELKKKREALQQMKDIALKDINFNTKDFSMIVKSNNLEQIYGLYSCHFSGHRPSLWEVYNINESLIQTLCTCYDKRVFQNTVFERFDSIIDFNTRFLSKIIPSGKKQDEKNFLPIQSFATGSQFIMNNIYSFDLNNLIYSSLFEQNGGFSSGFVLKPNFLRKKQNDNLSESQQEDSIQQIESGQNKVSIKLISAHQLRVKNDNKVSLQFVEIMLLQTQRDYSQIEQFESSNIVKNNNYNPQFNLECSFSYIIPELSFLVFQVIDSNEKWLVGWYAIPLSCIRQGLRTIPLCDEFYHRIKNSYLLCSITLR